MFKSLKASLRRYEDSVFAWAAEAEYQLGLAKRGTRLVPTRMHRWMLRFFVAALLLMITVFVLAPAPRGARYMLVTLVVLAFVALGLLLIDAWPGVRALPPSSKSKGPPPSRQPPAPAPPRAPKRPGAKKP